MEENNIFEENVNDAMRSAPQNSFSQLVNLSNKMSEIIPVLYKGIYQLSSLNQSFKTAILRNIAEPFIAAGSQIRDGLSNERIIADLQRECKVFRFILIMSEKKWPLFLIQDELLMDDVLSTLGEINGDDEIVHLVDDFFNNGFLSELTEKWETNTVIRSERIPILLEAIEMHKSGHYFSSVSILMCQVYGIAFDIYDLEKKYNLTLEKKHKTKALKAFGLEEKSCDTEKGRITQSFLFIRHRFLVWRAALQYLNTEILCSSDSKKRWESQPLRNKICHGSQLNYGTLEHSLKAILVIDILIEYALEIEYSGKKSVQENHNGETKMD